MVAVGIRYDPEAVAFVIGDGRVVEISRDDAVVAPLPAVAQASIRSFERALTEYEEQDAATVNAVFLANVSLDEFDPDISDRDVALSYVGDQLSALAAREVQDEGPTLDVVALLAPLLAASSPRCRADRQLP